jgi:hypothetical protein
MPSVEVNFWAVLLAAVANMLIGSVWYSKAMFATKWMALIGKTEDEIRSSSASTAYIGMTVGALVMAYVMAHFVNYAGAATVTDGAAVGFWAWLGFIVTTKASDVLFEGRPKGLFAINAGYFLVALPVMGAILAAWV